MFNHIIIDMSEYTVLCIPYVETVCQPGLFHVYVAIPNLILKRKQHVSCKKYIFDHRNMLLSLFWGCKAGPCKHSCTSFNSWHFVESKFSLTDVFWSIQRSVNRLNFGPLSMVLLLHTKILHWTAIETEIFNSVFIT